MLKNKKGQGTVEYILLLAFGAIFAVQVMRFFNGVAVEGLRGLEGNIIYQSQAGAGFAR